MSSPQDPNQPSWAAYARPMGGVQDGYDPNLHEHYWEAQRVAATRGSLQWGFLAFFIGFGGYYVASLVLGLVLSNHASHFDPAAPGDPGPVLLLVFAPNLLLGLVPAIFSWWKGQGLRRDFGILPTFRDLVVGLACGGASFGCAWVLTPIIIKLHHGEVPTSGLTGLVDQKTIWLAVIAVFIAVGAPLTEELLMRGALWGALEHYKVPRYAILLLTALIFALIHLEPWRLPILFVGGVAIGAARMITGRIGASMIAHATNNLIPALVVYFAAQ